MREKDHIADILMRDTDLENAQGKVTNRNGTAWRKVAGLSFD